MTENATIRTVPRPRGELNEGQMQNLDHYLAEKERAEANYRFYVVRTLSDGASFARVSDYTGLSTNTLQRWKREAGR